MKNYIIITLLALGMFSQAQIFSSAESSKLSIGASFVEDNVGLTGIYDEKIGQYLSVGIAGTYLLDSKKTEVAGETFKLDFGDRFDLRARLNVHLGEVINFDENFDIYPGLNIGTHNLGFHTGARYSFADGFAAFGELNLPISKFDEDYNAYFNKTYFTIGVTLDLF